MQRFVISATQHKTTQGIQPHHQAYDQITRNTRHGTRHTDTVQGKQTQRKAYTHSTRHAI